MATTAQQPENNPTPDDGGSVSGEIGADVDSVVESLAEHARLTAVLRDKIAELGVSDRDRWVGLGCDEFLVPSGSPFPK